MNTFFSIILTLCSLSGCGNHDTSATTKTSDTKSVACSIVLTDSTKISYLALGDSYTIGQSVSLDQSYPYQLVARLNTQTKVNKPDIVAVTGWTTDQLINGINNSGLTTKTYDFVTLLIGVNDQFQGINEDTYSVKFRDVLNTAIRFAKGRTSRVFVLSIPDYSVTPFASGSTDDERATIAKQIDEFNAINKSISTKAGVNYLNITDISRQATDDASLITTDGLHPSEKMYALWVQKLLPLVKLHLN